MLHFPESLGISAALGAFLCRGENVGFARSVTTICVPLDRMVGSPGHQTARSCLTGQPEAIVCVPFAGDPFGFPCQSRGVSFCNLAGVTHGPKLVATLLDPIRFAGWHCLKT
jgi:hypothetical protein